MLFQSNQSKFYQELDGKSREENKIPDKEKTREFWSGIWEKDVKHNESADWIQKVAKELQSNKQQNIEITAFHLQSCITRGEVPDWMRTGWTVLLLRFKSKGNEVSNYRPITCLPLMWKLLTDVIADELNNLLEDNYLLLEEQKGCRRSSRYTKDQLLIDKAVMKNCRRRKVWFSMVWIDYSKAYDMVPHLWIKKIHRSVWSCR